MLAVVSGALLTRSNFIISKRQEAEKQKDFIDQEMEEIGPGVPNFQKSQGKKSRDLDTLLSGYDKSEPKIKHWGISLFVVAIIVGVVPLIFSVSSKISDKDAADNAQTQNTPTNDPDQPELDV